MSWTDDLYEPAVEIASSAFDTERSLHAALSSADQLELARRPFKGAR